jgi:hypothetical protein
MDTVLLEKLDNIEKQLSRIADALESGIVVFKE